MLHYEMLGNCPLLLPVPFSNFRLIPYPSYKVDYNCTVVVIITKLPLTQSY